MILNPVIAGAKVETVKGTLVNDTGSTRWLIVYVDKNNVANCIRPAPYTTVNIEVEKDSFIFVANGGAGLVMNGDIECPLDRQGETSFWMVRGDFTAEIHTSGGSN